MKVLVIGNADLVLVKKVIEHTLLSYGDQVTILSRKNSIFKDFYLQNHVQVYQQNKMVSWLGLFNTIHNVWIVVHHYDLICVHNIEDSKVFLARIGALFSNKFILAFWGSDLLRKKRKSKIVEKGIKKSSAIVIPTNEMRNAFHEMYGVRYDDKISKARFGASGLEMLRDQNNDVTQFRKKYGIDKSKVIIAIGYNKAVQQQHLHVLREISILPADVKNRIHLLLRLTYGNGNAEYVKKVVESTTMAGCTYSIFESFLYDKEMSELTSMTDIFIHAQTTDSRSATMLEHLYAGTLVFNPSWIHYSELEGNVFDLKYDRFEDLRKLIMENLFRKDESPYREKLLLNKEMVYKNWSWDAQVAEWRNVYSNVAGFT